MKAVIRQGFSIEAVQYLIAILGILAADENLWLLIRLVIPMVITFGARVIAVADSFDAMTSDRPYRRVYRPNGRSKSCWKDAAVNGIQVSSVCFRILFLDTAS